MVRSICSLGLHGVSGYLVNAACDLSGGLPAFTVVGLPDTAVNEARAASPFPSAGSPSIWPPPM